MLYERYVTWACVVLLAAVLATATAAPSKELTVRIGHQKQLFVDDYIIGQMKNVSQVLNPVTKYPGNPVVKPDQPWEKTPLPQIFLYGSVIYDEDEKLFKMWYESYGQSTGCYATSKDGIHWHKPDLGVVEFEGSKRNNLVNWMGMGMIHAPDDPDLNKRYKALAGVRGSFSPDGLRWTVPVESKGIPGNAAGDHPAGDHVAPFCYDELSGRYVAFPKVVRKSGKYLRRSVSVSFSKDFLSWTPVRTVLVPDKRDDELARQRVAAQLDRVEFNDGPEWHIAQFYGHCGFPYEGMYLGMLWVFDISGFNPSIVEKRGRTPSTGGEDGPSTAVELTSSRDLIHWQRSGDRKLLITGGKPGSFDAGRLYTVNRPLIVGDEIWIYYGGFERTHGRHTDDWSAAHASSGIGLAKLRLDGWVSVDADDGPGTLTTKPLKLAGNDLVINADARKGQMAVEILGQAGRPLPGFSLADCKPFSGDSVRHTVQWKSSSDLSQLKGQPVRLRFHIQNAKLYSFLVSEQE